MTRFTWVDVLRLPFVIGAPIVVYLHEDTNGAFVGSAAALMIAFRFAPLPRLLDAALVVAFAIAAWGNVFDMYDWTEWFGWFVHALTSSLTGPALYVMLVAIRALPEAENRHGVGVWLTMLGFSMTIGAGWEILEWTSDGLFDTHLVSLSDMAEDLIADAIGAAAGSAAAIWLLLRSPYEAGTRMAAGRGTSSSTTRG